MNEDLSKGWKPEGPLRLPGRRAVRPKPSATLMIIRRDGPSPRILMGRRHSGHDFMPERWVFPGGRVDRGDWRAPSASDLRPEVQATFDMHLRPSFGRALALAAVRETWEEAGLLLARPAPSRPGAGAWRGFLAAGALPDLAAIEILGRAITPPKVGKRFDAWALTADAERLMSLDRQPDCGELEEIAWFEFEAALELKLARVTRVFVTVAADRLNGQPRPSPFIRYRQGASRVDQL